MKKLLLTFGIFISLSLIPFIVFAGSSDATTEANGATTESQYETTGDDNCNHVWGEWKLITEPTCNNDGTEYRRCTICSRIEYHYIPATNHHTWSEWTTDLTESCFSDNTQRRHCKFCYIQETRTIPAWNKHDWGEWHTWNEPDCFTKGYRERICSRCFEIESRTIPAYGKHDWSKWSFSILPTCATAGKKVRTCRRCDEDQTVIIDKSPLYHSYTNWTLSKQPTVMQTGQKTRMCFYCGSIEHLPIPKLSAKLVLKKTRLTMQKGTKKSFPSISYATGDRIKSYKSSNKKIAIVNKKGIITAKKKGTARIFVIMKSGIQKHCIIKIK